MSPSHGPAFADVNPPRGEAHRGRSSDRASLEPPDNAQSLGSLAQRPAETPVPLKAGVGPAPLKAFWSAVAPRCKNRTHVFYEMTNEPVQGGPHWGAPEQYTDKVLADLKSVYVIMRTAAPKTHIVLFTAANLWPTCASWVELIRKMGGIDWTKASVGFHHYNGTHTMGEAGVQCIRSQYPLLMTETNYWVLPERAVLRNALSLYEKSHMSWFSLDGQGTTYRLENEIIPALHRDGYFWPPEG